MKRKTLLFVSLAIFSYVIALPKLPVATKHPQEKEMHDVKWIDNYDYMSKSESINETVKYIKAENKYTKKISKSFTKLQKTIYTEIKSRFRENDLSVPYRIDDWQYYYEERKGDAYGVSYRINIYTQEKQVLIDSNKLAKGHNFYDLGEFSISPNDSILAYSVDYEGAEQYTLYLKDTKTGKHYNDTIKNVDSIVWFNDSKTFFYTKQDDKYIPNKLYKHVVGTDPAEDKLIFEEKDDAFYLYPSKSRSKDIIFVNTNSKTSSETWYISANNPNDELKNIHLRKPNIQIYPAHYDNKFYLYTSEFEPNYQYYEVQGIDFNDKELLFSGDEFTVLEGVSHFKDFYVLSERINGQNRIRVINKSTNNQHSLDFAAENYSVELSVNPDDKSDSLRFSYDSLTEPSILYQINMKELGQTKISDYKVLRHYLPLGNYKKEDYEEQLVFVDLADGQRVPLMLVYKKDLFTGNNPCLLTAYGSYGDSDDPYFSISRLSLLDRGWIYAIAQIRGGGNLGKSWHDQGKLLNRKNTFADFITCAEYLIKNGYTSPQKLAIEGGSAGGMLIGAVINQRPELFRTAIADVPFVDVLNTMLDSSQSLTVTEYDEWGNPNDKKFFDYIASYSPYDQVVAQNYPHLLITAGFRDTRVTYWEPLKWTAKLREMKTDKHLLLLKMNMNEGHSGSGDRYSIYKDIAFSYAFLIWTIEQERFEK